MTAVKLSVISRFLQKFFCSNKFEKKLANNTLDAYRKETCAILSLMTFLRWKKRKEAFLLPQLNYHESRCRFYGVIFEEEELHLVIPLPFSSSLGGKFMQIWVTALTARSIIFLWREAQREWEGTKKTFQGLWEVLWREEEYFLNEGLDLTSIDRHSLISFVFVTFLEFIHFSCSIHHTFQSIFGRFCNGNDLFFPGMSTFFSPLRKWMWGQAWNM